MRRLNLLALGVLMTLPTFGQTTVNRAKFIAGDNLEYSKPGFDDSSWRQLDITRNWDSQGVPKDTRFGWYRLRFTPDRSMLANSDQKDFVIIDLGPIDDADETYLNGELIGKTGQIPSDKGGYRSAWSTPRRYVLPVDHKALKWGEENIVSVRCYSGNEPGGMFQSPARIYVPNAIDGASIGFSEGKDKKGKQCNVTLSDSYPVGLSGEMQIVVRDLTTNKVVSESSKKCSIAKGKSFTVGVPVNATQCLEVSARFTDNRTGKSIESKFIPKYILTPKAPATPRFNTAPVYGVRPGSPIHYRFGVSGQRPMSFSSADLPKGLTLNPSTGALSGTLTQRGDVTFSVTAKNGAGEATQTFTIKVGDKIALTPPMGWNSWNCWGLSVSQDKVMSSAKALIDKGLADYGYAYINVDDAWEAPQRSADGRILVNEKFPDMKALGDTLHAQGLKFGIYSSPGDYTCGGYLGSIDHEKQDAETYNSWGVDYLKYDWCGYGRKHGQEVDRNTVASYVRPYLLMEQYLREQPRDIFYSLCQYGMADVWKWGRAVDANSWRTTGDIEDTWDSVVRIGFEAQAPLAEYAGPGGWNDPDMLVVGKVGWSNNLRDSRLTPDEQYSHISLWALLASNMLIGCDLAQLDDFTINLLCNNEVNAVNQDVLGKQATRILKSGNGDTQIWARPLSDGSIAMGVFNMGPTTRTVRLADYLGAGWLQNVSEVRDLWRQENLDPSQMEWTIPSHGVRLLKLKKK